MWTEAIHCLLISSSKKYAYEVGWSSHLGEQNLVGWCPCGCPTCPRQRSGFDGGWGDLPVFPQVVNGWVTWRVDFSCLSRICWGHAATTTHTHTPPKLALDQEQSTWCPPHPTWPTIRKDGSWSPHYLETPTAPWCPKRGLLLALPPLHLVGGCFHLPHSLPLDAAAEKSCEQHHEKAVFVCC